jgi:hypothetical protein
MGAGRPTRKFLFISLPVTVFFHQKEHVEFEAFFSIGEKLACLADMLKIQQSLQQTVKVHRDVRPQGSHIF